MSSAAPNAPAFNEKIVDDFCRESFPDRYFDNIDPATLKFVNDEYPEPESGAMRQRISVAHDIVIPVTLNALNLDALGNRPAELHNSNHIFIANGAPVHPDDGIVTPEFPADSPTRGFKMSGLFVKAKKKADDILRVMLAEVFRQSSDGKIHSDGAMDAFNKLSLSQYPPEVISEIVEDVRRDLKGKRITEDLVRKVMTSPGSADDEQMMTSVLNARNRCASRNPALIKILVDSVIGSVTVRPFGYAMMDGQVGKTAPRDQAHPNLIAYRKAFFHVKDNPCPPKMDVKKWDAEQKRKRQEMYDKLRGKGARGVSFETYQPDVVDRFEAEGLHPLHLKIQALKKVKVGNTVKTDLINVGFNAAKRLFAKEGSTCLLKLVFVLRIDPARNMFASLKTELRAIIHLRGPVWDHPPSTSDGNQHLYMAISKANCMDSFLEYWQGDQPDIVSTGFFADGTQEPSAEQVALPPLASPTDRVEDMSDAGDIKLAQDDDDAEDDEKEGSEEPSDFDSEGDSGSGSDDAPPPASPKKQPKRPKTPPMAPTRIKKLKSKK